MCVGVSAMPFPYARHELEMVADGDHRHQLRVCLGEPRQGCCVLGCLQKPSEPSTSLGPCSWVERLRPECPQPGGEEIADIPVAPLQCAIAGLAAPASHVSRAAAEPCAAMCGITRCGITRCGVTRCGVNRCGMGIHHRRGSQEDGQGVKPHALKIYRCTQAASTKAYLGPWVADPSRHRDSLPPWDASG